MTITIKFNDNIEHKYDSFEEILKIDNYNDIIDINCHRNNLLYLPKLPNLLTHLTCGYNNLSSLPELPNTLTKLMCYDNNLSILPELPNSLNKLYCNSNNLHNLPELPNSLQYLYCWNNKLSSLPELPNSLITLSCSYNKLSSLPKIPNSAYIFNYDNNPIHFHIKKYFYNNTKKYFDHQRQMRRIFVNKIGNWYLDCKYNPKYLYCRNRLMKEYKELYGK